MPRRHKCRWSTSAVPGDAVAPAKALALLYISAVVRSCKAAFSSASMPRSRSRTCASVAAMRAARSRCIGCRYLSMRPAISAASWAAVVAKLSLATPPAGMRTLTRRQATGSSPLTGASCASAAQACATAGCARLRLRPKNTRRSVMQSSDTMSASACAKKCAADSCGSPCKRGRRVTIKARQDACHVVLIKRFENAGCASSALASASTTSKQEITSYVTARFSRLVTDTVRNSVSSSGLTSTVVVTCSAVDAASNCTRSAMKQAWYCHCA